MIVANYHLSLLKMASRIRKLTLDEASQLKLLLKNETKFSGFCITKGNKLQCNVCLLQLNYRDVNILKRHLKSLRHVTHEKLNRFEAFYNKWCENETAQIVIHNNRLLKTVLQKLNGLILAQKNREPVSSNLVDEALDEARTLLTGDCASIG